MTAIPLLNSQQILAWALRALGLTDNLLISEGTLKAARRGAPIPKTWDDLVGELARVFGKKPIAAATIEPMLRDFDAGVNRIDVVGLLANDRVTAMALTFGAELAVRCGALAALFELSKHQFSRPEIAKRFADYATDPLSPSIFGHVVNALFDVYQPDLVLRSDRGGVVEDDMGLGQRTYERWYDGKIRVPNLESLKSVAIHFATDHPSDVEAVRAEWLLRLARAMCQLQKDVAKVVDADMAEALRQHVKRGAERARAAFLQPTCQNEVLGFVQEHLDGTHGEQASTIFKTFGFNPDDVNDLWWLRLHIVLPLPRLRAATCAMTQSLPGQIALTLSLPQQLQAHVETGRLLSILAQGDWPDATIHNHDGRIANARDLAPDLHQRFDLRARFSPDYRPMEEWELQFLMTTAVREQGGNKAVIHYMNSVEIGKQQIFYPAPVEAKLSDDEVAHFPHMMVERAKRLAEELDVDGAMAWFKRWVDARKHGHSATTEERHTAATAAVELAHEHIELGFNVLANAQDIDTLEALNPVFQQRIQLAERLQHLAFQLFNPRGDHRELTARAITCLPLAIRIAYWSAELDRPLSHPDEFDALAESVTNITEPQRQHPDAWVALALWKEATDEDPSFATKQAVHHGGGDRLTIERQRLVDDGVFAPG